MELNKNELNDLKMSQRNFRFFKIEKNCIMLKQQKCIDIMKENNSLQFALIQIKFCILKCKSSENSTWKSTKIYKKWKEE